MVIRLMPAFFGFLSNQSELLIRSPRRAQIIPAAPETSTAKFGLRDIGFMRWRFFSGFVGRKHVRRQKQSFGKSQMFS